MCSYICVLVCIPLVYAFENYISLNLRIVFQQNIDLARFQLEVNVVKSGTNNCW